MKRNRCFKGNVVMHMLLALGFGILAGATSAHTQEVPYSCGSDENVNSCFEGGGTRPGWSAQTKNLACGRFIEYCKAQENGQCNINPSEDVDSWYKTNSRPLSNWNVWQEQVAANAMQGRYENCENFNTGLRRNQMAVRHLIPWHSLKAFMKYLETCHNKRTIEREQRYAYCKGMPGVYRAFQALIAQLGVDENTSQNVHQCWGDLTAQCRDEQLSQIHTSIFQLRDNLFYGPQPDNAGVGQRPDLHAQARNYYSDAHLKNAFRCWESACLWMGLNPWYGISPSGEILYATCQQQQSIYQPAPLNLPAITVRDNAIPCYDSPSKQYIRNPDTPQ